MKRFAEDVRAEVANILGDEVEVVVVDVPKVNGTKTAVCVRNGDIGANFYIDSFDGISVADAANEIVECYKNTPKLPFDPSAMDMSFEAIKDKVIPRVVCIDKNKELLETVVYKDMGCGIAIIPAIDMHEGFICNITNEVAEANGYDRFELIDVAISNATERYPAKMSSIVDSLFGGGEKNALNSENPKDDIGDGFVVLTNEKGWLGASAIFYDGILDKAKDILGEPFFMLPSSIHEVILVPESFGNRASELKRMVVEANRSVVEECDVLSDNVYYFNGELNMVA